MGRRHQLFQRATSVDSKTRLECIQVDLQAVRHDRDQFGMHLILMLLEILDKFEG